MHEGMDPFRAPGNRFLDFGQSALTLDIPVSSLINAHFVCDFQDVHISFPETSSQTIQISFPSFAPCLFDLEKHWIKKNVEPLVMCSSFNLWHLAHFFLVGYKNL